MNNIINPIDILQSQLTKKSNIKASVNKLLKEFEIITIQQMPNVPITIVIAENGCDVYYEVYKEDMLIFTFGNDIIGDNFIYSTEMVLAEALTLIR